MYYSESETLITKSPSDKGDIIQIDRAIAHAYAPGGHGWTDDAFLLPQINLTTSRLHHTITRYASQGVVETYYPLECSHGHIFDANEKACPDCQEPANMATSSGLSRYRILKQPKVPAFYPMSVQQSYDIFLSYRHLETERLASDLYYAFKARNFNVFLDAVNIPTGNDFESVYLPAASNSPHFIFLASATYFNSENCKMELAHALRTAKNVIPVSIGSKLTPPYDMPWINKMSPCRIIGDGQGLSRDLEDFLRPIVEQSPAPVNYKHRLDACIYLFEKMPLDQKLSCLATSDWLASIMKLGTGPADWTIAIRQGSSSSPTRLDELCSALAPRN